MNNQHVTDQLNDYLDGQLPPDAARRVESHLTHCTECRNEQEHLRSLLSKAVSLPKSIQPSRDLWKGIEERLGGGEPRNVLEFRESKGTAIPRSGLSRWLRYGSAIAAVLVIGVVGWLWYSYQIQTAWNVAASGGTVTIGSAQVDGAGRIRIGEMLQTDERARAKIEIGHIGHVDVDPNTRIRLVEATLTDHRLALDEGTIHATIFAPPRIFFVETPSALAVDLGCAYTLQVDNKGASLLEVTSGWVSLEFGGRESIVPAGAMCATRPGHGPGTPFQEDASDKLKAALGQYDFENGGSASLEAILAEARNVDSITLWHLMFRTSGDERGRTYDRLASLVPAPKGVTRKGMLAGDPEMIKKWQKQLNLGQKPWWKVWM